MSRKSEEVPLESLAAFSEAFTNLAEGLRATTEMATKSGQPITSTNWTTAVRGLDYVRKFVDGLALQAATGGSRKQIDELRAEIENQKKAAKAMAEAVDEATNSERPLKRTPRRKKTESER